MTYDELAAALFNAQQWVTLCAFVLLGVGIYLALAPVGSCDRCAHCRQERMDRGLGATTMCPQHGTPRTECREEHRP